ncbi:thioredoxin-dependent thiol peroxidase [Sedimenticola hydrogenitrophicus]|uniref:thioredoxin-dependent thiol peroxidase n=1 Tax=Sedimenticola hydrogenitrophicus TaxID=2967975 RepID=UPI0021A30A61|nr:thioredoxin-dependent thiol peroxidase [Sedimenticola hydrogenitrophicus]
MTYPETGKKAPAFSLPDQNRNMVSLADYLGKNVVVYFYPKASTPGCTVQACGIRDYKRVFEKLNAVVLGISPDAPQRLVNFTEKQGLNFTLLADEDHAVAEAYGVWGEKKFMGRVFDGIHRTTFIVDADGILRQVMDKVKTKTHHEDVARYIEENL